MPNWKKLIVSGSDASLNTLFVGNAVTASIVSASTGITGSLFGTASWAQSSSRAISSSVAVTSSYVTGSIFTGTNLATSSSFALTASRAIAYPNIISIYAAAQPAAIIQVSMSNATSPFTSSQWVAFSGPATGIGPAYNNPYVATLTGRLATATTGQLNITALINNVSFSLNLTRVNAAGSTYAGNNFSITTANTNIASVGGSYAIKMYASGQAAIVNFNSLAMSLIITPTA